MAGPGQPGFEPRTRAPERRDFYDLRRRIVEADEVWVGSDPPPADHYELWYDPAATPPPIFANGTYTPTLTNMAVGTGGNALNTATYSYVGGTEVGDKGLLVLDGAAVLGTSGASMGSAPTLALPTGFNFAMATLPNVNLIAVGDVTVDDTSANQRVRRPAAVATAHTWRPYNMNHDTVAGSSSFTATVPITWAAGDMLAYHIAAQVVRV